jgi:hypothetical protein
MSDFHLLDEYLVVYRDGGRRHEAIRSELDRRFAQMERLRAIEAAAREVAAKWLANWGPVQHHREFVEAVKSLVAVFEKETP